MAVNSSTRLWGAGVPVRRARLPVEKSPLPAAPLKVNRVPVRSPDGKGGVTDKRLMLNSFGGVKPATKAEEYVTELALRIKPCVPDEVATASTEAFWKSTLKSNTPLPAARNSMNPLKPGWVRLLAP